MFGEEVKPVSRINFAVSTVRERLWLSDRLPVLFLPRISAHWRRTNAGGTGSARGTPKKPSRRDHSGQASPAQSGRTTPSATPSGGAGTKQNPRVQNPVSKPPRNTIIITSQQHAIRTHLDAFTDVIVLRNPMAALSVRTEVGMYSSFTDSEVLPSY
jgi:hypothetical protein